ncbi:40S ribosomal protein S20e, putative [Plasmodium malariae]|uniref:40S ribosomal protein S20e, putative n=1 Tax=Plasmodium malariae TaxID=5858 RepID=A0A1C3KXY4_PLAMA|nr:40S ribosomal protein S20e, putative [Plasmodium malariae]
MSKLMKGAIDNEKFRLRRIRIALTSKNLRAIEKGNVFEKNFQT